MTDATAGRGGVGIRLFVQGGEVVRRTFDQIGESGKKMWSEIAVGERTANPAIKGLSGSVNEAKTALDGLVGRAGPAGTALSSFGAAGVLAAAALGGLALALVKVREGMQFAADLTDAADRIGVGAEALQEWRYVADEAGVSTDAFQANLERLNGQVGAFKSGIGDGRLKPIFEELGITKGQLDNVSTAQDMMILLADTLGQVKDRAVQVRMAKGLGVEESLPILRLGSEEIRRLSKDARDLGLVMSDEVRAEFDEADRAIEVAQQRIQMSMRVAVVGLADDFALLITSIADVVGWLGKLNSMKIENPGVRAGQWVNDQARQALGLGRNPDRAARLGGYDGFDADAVFRSIQDIAGPPTGGGFDPRGHARPSSGRGNAARQAEREAEQRRQRQERAEDQRARAERDLSAAWNRGEHMQTIGARAANEIQRLEEQNVQRLKEIARAQEEYVRSKGLRGLTDAEAALLVAKQEELTAVEQSLVRDRERADIAKRRLRDEEDASRAAIEYLDVDAQMAQTQRERYRIEREILLATIEIARKRKQAELDADVELDNEQRAARMGIFNRNANRQLELFDHRETERLRAVFKGYGREVVDAIQQGRVGEYIGDRLKERLMDGGLDALFNMISSRLAGGGGGGDGGSSAWVKGAQQVAGWLFGGNRASGGGTQAGRSYATVEHGRPELFMLSGQGHIVSAAETARMIADVAGHKPGQAQGGDTFNFPPIIINAEGADREGLARVEQSIERLRDDMPGIAIKSVADARSRRIIP